MKLSKILIALLVLVFLGMGACTNLEEDLKQDITGQAAQDFLAQTTDVDVLLASSYEGLRIFQHHEQVWGTQQHTSDETIGPTRGPDWDDNGIWRSLHQHTWNADHNFLNGSFNLLLQVVFSTTNALTFNPSAQQAAEARFLRAFVMFAVADGWGQVPFRQPGDNLLNAPTVLSGADALQFVIDECETIIGDLPDSGPNFKASKDAAKVLLMKAYLNKGTFASRANPEFPAGDMAEVIKYADEIMMSGKYMLTDNFFDSFATNNDQIGTGNIFTNENRGGVSSGLVRQLWFSGLHYNMNPSGWNGFATIAETYDRFDPADQRIGGVDYPGMTDVGGVKIGFLIGQQFDETGAELEDRKGDKLAFTKEVKAIETGSNLEYTGIRVMKYPIDYVNGDNSDNDFVFYRLADVMLMKAEALLRSGGSVSDATGIVNTIRNKRGLGDLAGSLTLNELLDERSRELYWEGHRRQDLIRFGRFLEDWTAKGGASGPERLLFPIPNAALSVNPNLTQNPGY